jgi:NAD-dependent dihydropyrimidine dehydrogenase PreA subunit
MGNYKDDTKHDKRKIRHSAAKRDDWFGISREEIEWFPTIDYEKCIGCLACVKKCSHGVYSTDEKAGKPLVADKLRCIVGCRGCEAICPTKAISHPPISKIKELAKRRNVEFKLSCCGEK